MISYGSYGLSFNWVYDPNLWMGSHGMSGGTWSKAPQAPRYHVDLAGATERRHAAAWAMGICSQPLVITTSMFLIHCFSRMQHETFFHVVSPDTLRVSKHVHCWKGCIPLHLPILFHVDWFNSHLNPMKHKIMKSDWIYMSPWNFIGKYTNIYFPFPFKSHDMSVTHQFSRQARSKSFAPGSDGSNLGNPKNCWLMMNYSKFKISLFLDVPQSYEVANWTRITRW
jgi:hypothetical protein